MIATLVQWWRLRSERERVLLLVMFALVALVLLWLIVIRPLADALDSAKQRHGEAVSALAEARARMGAAAGASGGPTASAPLPVDSHIGRTAAEAGFTGARIVARGPARASVSIDAARPQAVFAWLGRMEQDGLVVESLRARANDDRTLAVELELKARGR
ncbi:type II secretion system protein GspM [Sphingosinicella sp. CPCC 101087]|uniref:type II secretion system protein GspM n=1 Tax=Sphingosinicella sp. CPCC 101087 TaxID=2497754 RepID=UPI00101D8BD6|nr:type II secretion system protein GspM [Sphingosinicella sp. CPCC 101087]